MEFEDSLTPEEKAMVGPVADILVAAMNTQVQDDAKKAGPQVTVTADASVLYFSAQLVANAFLYDKVRRKQNRKDMLAIRNILSGNSTVKLLLQIAALNERGAAAVKEMRLIPSDIVVGIDRELRAASKKTSNAGHEVALLVLSMFNQRGMTAGASQGCRFVAVLDELFGVLGIKMSGRSAAQWALRQ